ncbi:MAG: GDP-mannose 4,6-dehydratase [Verrucomicrobia bacterium]|nr:GDP-mannose 4,6-dehydratase [Verrucomicrobiota bacterium]MDA1048225.1 GDP-mannose 4,6-dehydratase [Verrucomicrobiota bacterium]
MSKKYLVTGVAGFIASQVCGQLLDLGHQVVGVDNLNDYYDVRLKDWRLEQLENSTNAENFHFEKLDIENHPALQILFDQFGPFDAVLNLAARAGVRYSMENPYVYLSTNAEGTLNLLECMRSSGVNKLVLASTSSLYAGQPMPFTESLPVNEPLSPYAASKKAAELMAYSYHKLYGIDVSVVRYFTVFGPAGRPDMSPYRFIKWIAEEETIQMFGDGSQSRDFTYVEDIARGSVAAIQEVGYEIINLGGGRHPVSLNAIIERLESLLGKKAKIENKPFHIADLKETWADIDKAKNLLGWEPRVSLDDGLEKSVQWYVDNRDWLKDIEV